MENKFFENWYLLENWEEFCTKFNFPNSIFVGSIGFEKRSLQPLKTLTKTKKDLSKIQFFYFLLDNKEIDDEDTQKVSELKTRNEKTVQDIKIKSNLLLEIISYSVYNEDKVLTGYDKLYCILNEYFRNAGDSLNVFLDISGFPRIIFIPLIKILYETKKVANLYILWTNKKGMQNETNAKYFDQPLDFPNFYHLDPEPGEIVFWLPILGYDPSPIEILLNQRHFNKETVFYPLITFPHLMPEETKGIFLKNKLYFLNDTFEYDKILYVPYNNPFEFFLKIKDFYESKKKILQNNFYILISPFGSKAQSIGASLAGILLESKISLQICKAGNYHCDANEDTLVEEESFIAGVKLNSHIS